jgi:hypothetical protein
LSTLLTRIASALERLAPARQANPPLDAAEAFVWRAEDERLVPVEQINRLDLTLLKGIERQSETLLDNTRRFADALPANNALLWGARGMGKSSLVKAIHGEVNSEREGEGKLGLVLVEIHREDIPTLPRLLQRLRVEEQRCILFCDDLSFHSDDTSYKSLKAVLEGGIEGRPDNVIFYATSNRRHLMPRDMIENERSTAIHTAEAVDEKVSLSDRFGLWLGFHNCNQDTYFDMVEGYAQWYGLALSGQELRAEAKEWAITRGARNGRVAWQFIQDLAGRQGKRLD